MAADVKSLLKNIRKLTKSESFETSKFGEVTEWISTGDYGLNRIISGSIYNGIPAGRVVLISGESAAGKSFVAAQIAANALNQLNYDLIFYFDSEGGAMREFFKSRGCDSSKIEQVLVDNVEDATIKILGTYEKIETFKADNPGFKCLFILDSLGALVASKFTNDAAAGKVVFDMGARSKLVNNFVKGVTMPALRTNTSLIITNHVMDNPGALHPTKIKSQGGGKGIQYMSRISIQCSKTFEKATGKGENYYKGSFLKFFTIKNSMVKPFYTSVMYLDYASGPHKYFGLVDIAVKYGLLTKPNVGYYSVPSYAKNPTKRFRLKELLDCDEAWESFLPQLNEKSLADLSYGGNGSEQEYSDEYLDSVIDEESESGADTEIAELEE